MRKNYYDVLKAIAIVAVVLYHVGICEYGYLGVDIFLVIAGYFTSQSFDKHAVNGGGYLSFMSNRLFRLWPLLLLAGIICLGYGSLMMLPDDFENTAQSVVATNFFGNNILESITTKNYWDVGNEYKPLMHTWYVGLLMQYYVLVPFFLFVIYRIVKDVVLRKSINVLLMCLLCVISLVLYLIKEDACAKFYYLPYRLFEFCIGGLVFYLFGKNLGNISKNKFVNISFTMVYFVIIALLFNEIEIISRSSKLLIIVTLTCILLYLMPRVEWAYGSFFSNRWFALIGAASFSIFVWHQLVLAIIRYSFTNDLTEILPMFVFVFITSLFSLFSYKYIEQIKNTRFVWLTCIVALVFSTASSLYIYVNAGVVRDVPELDVKKGEAHRGIWAEYCDRGYKYDKEFTASETPKWFVIGNSFGRDFVNIILESGVTDSIEVSYSDMSKYKNQVNRFRMADIVFISTLGLKKELIEDVKARCSSHTRLFLIGEKNFGENNGQIYRRRHSANYHNMTVKMEEGYAEKNEVLRAAYPNIYIDLIEMVRQSDGRVRVFTEDGRFISQDCRHLTQAGAQFYAQLINWSIFH